MSEATALAKARELRVHLLAAGVPEVSIEIMEGRPVSGDRWDALRIVTNFAHHTVSQPSNGLTPCLSLVKKGRTGGSAPVPGPLCNGYGGWDLCYRIITFGLANHPGAGGPFTINNFTIPKDSARPYTWGTEWEGGVNASDWDAVRTNPRNGVKMTMREMMGRAHAGVQNYFKLPRTAHMEHKTWTTRKVDRLNYTQASGISEILRYARAEEVPDVTPEEMDTLADKVAARVWATRFADKYSKDADGKSSAGTFMVRLNPGPDGIEATIREEPWKKMADDSADENKTQLSTVDLLRAARTDANKAAQEQPPIVDLSDAEIAAIADAIGAKLPANAENLTRDDMKGLVREVLVEGTGGTP